MTRAVQLTGLWLRFVRDRSTTRLRAMAVEQPRLLITLAMAASVLLLGGVAAGWSAAARVGSEAPGSTEPAPFVVVCNECGQKTRFQDAPVLVLPKHAGFLQCPGCKAFAGVSHRRGSTSVPPGGF